jgi:hypothetical protein
VIETTPAGYYLVDTIGVRMVHVLLGLIWIGIAAAAACGAILTGTAIAAAVVDDSALSTQLWGLVALAFLAGIVTVGMLVLTWQRLAAAVRPVPARYAPAPTGSTPR